MRPIRNSLARAALLCVSALACVTSGVESARAQPTELPTSAGVTLEVIEPFGPSTTPEGPWFPLRVRLENTTDATQRGRVRVGHRFLPFGTPPMLQHALVELPPRSTRELVVPYALGGRYAGSGAQLEFDPEGGEPVTWELMGTGGRTLLMIEVPPLRRAVDEMVDTGAIYLNQGYLETPGGAGDLGLPESALDMLSVATIAVPVRVLDRATPAQLAMLADWTSLGGHLVMYARDESDLNRPWVRDWVGEVTLTPQSEVEPVPELDEPERDENGEPIAAPTEAHVGMALTCSARTERGGCSRALGSGRVFLAGYDPSTWTETDAARVHDLAACHAAQDSNRRHLEARVGLEEVGESIMRTLDPNTGFTPALGLVAFVLLAYLIFVGPLNFRFVQKRNRPMLALATTPALAFLCLLVLFGVGFIGKGFRARYRSFELIELSEGHPRGLSHRYTGLYTTSPRTYDLRFDRATRARWLPGSPGRRPVRRMRGDEHVLEGITSGLWETRLVHETRLVEVGELEVEWAGSTQPLAVRNATGSAITGAVLMYNTSVYRLGDIPAGGRVELPSTPAARLGGNYWEVDAGELVRLYQEFGMSSEDRPQLRALARALGGHVVEPDCAVVYGRLPGGGETIADIFSADRETRFLRSISPSPALAAFVPLPPAPGVDPTFGRLGMHGPDSRVIGETMGEIVADEDVETESLPVAPDSEDAAEPLPDEEPGASP